MLRKRCESGRCGLAVWVGVLALLGGTAAAPALGGDGACVRRNGERVRLIQSQSELLVKFADPSRAPAGAQRLVARGLGTVQHVPHIKPSPYRLLHGQDVSMRRRRQIREDAAIVSVRPVYRFEGTDTPMMSTGTIVVRLRADVSDAERDAMFAAYRVRIVKPADGLDDVYMVEPTWSDADEVRRAEALATDHRTVWAQPNLLFSMVRRQVVPLDPFFSKQWHLNNTGQDGGIADADIDAPEAWVISEGADVRFGIFDDGFDIDHEDLRANYSGIGHDASVDTDQGGANDPTPKGIGDRHGTAVLGLALARGNGIGVRGVSYLSQFTATAGLGELMTPFQIAGIYTFARQDDVDVHINSWGPLEGGFTFDVVVDALETAYRQGRDLDGSGGDPPRGMVIVFASGNLGRENVAGSDYSVVPWVIGVGASTNRDQVADFSNYGMNINILAPGEALIATTDIEDRQGNVDDGYNQGGVIVFDNGDTAPELDQEGSYTGFFGGTSAACPIVAGTAGLMLATAPNLTALDVRLILEHTVDKVDATTAEYDSITGRSERYGYGRINAFGAVTAAQDSLTNGGLSWPDMPKNFRNIASQLAWTQGAGTGEFLLVQSDAPFAFVPQDSACYSQDQDGCESIAPTALPSGVEILFVGCQESEGDGTCQIDSDHRVTFSVQEGETKHFGLYARSGIGRYSFGVTFEGSSADTDPVDDPTEPDTTPEERPAVTISVSPLEGLSPLTVSFAGNAVSENEIDQTQTQWVFDISNLQEGTSSERNTTHTYEATPETRREVTARLTMVDVMGNIGSASATISIDGGGNTDSTIGDSDVQILVGVPGSPGSDVAVGTAPFSVELRIDVNTISGTLQSVFWDLGDGTTTTPLVVPHVYQNTGDQNINYMVTAVVTTETSAGTTLQTQISRIITVLPEPEEFFRGDANQNGTGPVVGNGTNIPPCAPGIVPPLLFATVSLMWVRRRRLT